MRLHATSIAIDKLALLITGESGAGKSSLAIELLTRGAALISDDQTLLSTENGALLASAPPKLAGLIEVYGVGIVPSPRICNAPTAVAFELQLVNEQAERLPDLDFADYMGVRIQRVTLAKNDPILAAKTLFLTQVFQQNGEIALQEIANNAA